MDPEEDRIRDERIQNICSNDDIVLAQEYTSAYDGPSGNRFSCHLLFEEAIRQNALKVVEYLLSTKQIDVSSLEARDILYGRNREEKLNTDVGELLIKYGWDINHRGPTAAPLLWRVADDEDLLQWCLDHGAKLTEPPVTYGWRGENVMVWYCGFLLESVIKRAQISFQLIKRLHSLGAPTNNRCLHFAAGVACHPNRRPELLEDDMLKLRFLVDEEGIDVNTSDAPDSTSKEGLRVVKMHGTPLAYCTKVGEQQVEVVRFLLERGADPTHPGVKQAIRKSKMDTSHFLRVVQSFPQWKYKMRRKYRDLYRKIEAPQNTPESVWKGRLRGR